MLDKQDLRTDVGPQLWSTIAQHSLKEIVLAESATLLIHSMTDPPGQSFIARAASHHGPCRSS